MGGVGNTRLPPPFSAFPTLVWKHSSVVGSLFMPIPGQPVRYYKQALWGAQSAYAGGAALAAGVAQRYRSLWGQKYSYPSQKGGMSQYRPRSSMGQGSRRILRSGGIKMKPEVKCVDTVDSIPFTSDATAKTFTPLNGLFVGSTWYQRTGKTIQILSVNLSLNIFLSGGATNAVAIKEELSRFGLLIQKNPAGAVPALIQTVFQARDKAAGASGTPYQLHIPLNQDTKKDYKLLWDQQILLPSVGVNGVPSLLQQSNVSGQPTTFTYYKQFKNFTVEYNQGNTATISDINKNALLFFQTCVNASSTNYQYTITYAARVKYVDG